MHSFMSHRPPLAVSPLPGRIAALLLTIAALLCPFSASAGDLSGEWNAGPLRVSWAIGDWGPGCGPRPSGGGQGGGTVTLTDRGADFALQGLGRNFQSTRCWESMPGLAPRSHSASEATITTMCTMPEGDPRQAKVVTAWHIRGDTIYFDETGQYQFVVKGNNCTASVRRTRVLKRVPPPAAEELPTDRPEPKPTSAPDPQTTPEPRPAGKSEHVAAPPSADPPPVPTRTSRCEKPGPPVRLEVTPKAKLMRPGESFQFTALARDRKGCRVKLEPHWKLEAGNELARISQDGTLTVTEGAPRGHVRLSARIEDTQVEVSARVVNQEEYSRLLDGGSYGAMGESPDTASINLLSSEVGMETTQGQPPQKGRGLIGLVALATILVVGLAAFLLWQRGRTAAPNTATSPPPEARDKAGVMGVASSSEGPASSRAEAEEVPAPAPAPAKERVCPVCGRRYPADSSFCGDDGARLVRAN